VIKVLAGLKRRPGLTPEEFATYYLETHVPLFRRVLPAEIAAGLEHYVQNHAVRLGRGTTDPPFDCVTEMGWRDLEAMQRWNAWYLSPEGKVLRDDEENFMDRDARVVVVTEEHRP
jgi:uncharacterized protein (TIGR02118 family)